MYTDVALVKDLRNLKISIFLLFFELNKLLSMIEQLCMHKGGVFEQKNQHKVLESTKNMASNQTDPVRDQEDVDEESLERDLEKERAAKQAVGRLEEVEDRHNSSSIKQEPITPEILDPYVHQEEQDSGLDWDPLNTTSWAVEKTPEKKEEAPEP